MRPGNSLLEFVSVNARRFRMLSASYRLSLIFEKRFPCLVFTLCLSAPSICCGILTVRGVSEQPRRELTASLPAATLGAQVVPATASDPSCPNSGVWDEDASFVSLFCSPAFVLFVHVHYDWSRWPHPWRPP